MWKGPLLGKPLVSLRICVAIKVLVWEATWHFVLTGGLYLSVIGAVEIKAHAFGLFLKSQRQWKSKPLEEDAADKFKQACEVNIT